MSETQRNFAIIAAVALVIVGLGQAGNFNALGNNVLLLLHIAFLAVISFALLRLYRRHSDTISSLPASTRLQLQVGAFGGYAVLITGLLIPGWAGWSGALAILFFLLVGLSGYAVYHAWQQRPFRW